MARLPSYRVMISSAVASLAVSQTTLAIAEPSGQPPAGVLSTLPDAAKDAVAAVPAGPVVEAARAKLAEKTFTGKTNAEDVAAAQAFYAGRADELWVSNGALSGRAESVLAEFKKAEDWGLEASAFEISALSSGASPQDLGAVEAKLTLNALKYARYARGGRVDPLSISNILDMKPPVKDPKIVIGELTAAADPGAYLTAQHPKHAGFEKLRQALLKARGPAEPDVKPVDEALAIKLPADGRTLKIGSESDDVILLRKRLKLSIAENANQRYFDEKLDGALRAFQDSKGLKANGQLTTKTRAALNSEGEAKKPESKGEAIGRLIVNMERWRWLPEDLGPFFVMNNVPEYISRVFKNDSEVFKTKLVVGQPTWPTPVLSAKMEYIVFHPEWGVPDGIKVKELLPRLKRASGSYGGGFFDQLFNGGSSGGARVLEAYKLTPTLNGKSVDPNKVDWNRVDIRQFSFVQPAGGENPLGSVKFRFPNRHDVYMHDTPQKALFAQSSRALSHGCMRVENPRRLAEVILGEDKGWSADKVGAQYGGGTNEVTLTTPVPVYLTYFTAQVDDTGKLVRNPDIYGHDDRLMSALQGRVVRYSAPEEGRDDEVASNTYDPPEPVYKKNKNQASKSKRPPQTVGDLLMDALSNF